MARKLGDIEYAQGFRFEWSEQRRDNGALCGWFFREDPDDNTIGTERLWITEFPIRDGETQNYFVQSDRSGRGGYPMPSLDMATAYFAGWFAALEQ